MFSAVKAVLIDLSGTVHIETKAIEGAKLALEKLQEKGLKVLFVTNTTTESKEKLSSKMKNCDLEIPSDRIFTSLLATSDLVRRRKLRPLLLLEADAEADFEGIPRENPNAVIVGLAPERFDYQHLDEAFRVLINGGALIAVHKSRYVRRLDGDLHLGPGAFITGLEFASGCAAEVVGKPEASFFQAALGQLGVAAEEAVMIGDDYTNDVEGAMKCGMKGILVKTGKYREGDEDRPELKPDLTCDNILLAAKRIVGES